MARTKVSDERLFQGLIRVFQDHGYDGATMTKLVAATGLERASLYHRFPAGKVAMAGAVLAHVGEHFANHVLAPLAEPGEPAERVARMNKRLREFYADGRRACLLETLSLGGRHATIQSAIERMFRAWLEALIRVARVAGVEESEARVRSRDALVRIQGALVTARALGETDVFERTLNPVAGTF
jgi:TetR/AcrR family transcriptional repressor of lmrAB and yxaGH operons